MEKLPDFIEKVDFAQMCGQYKLWNERINVISRKDIDNVWEHHILHSLGIALYLQSQMPDEFARWTGSAPGVASVVGGADSAPVRVLDVGCGGGFPGIPLAAVFPSVQFTLCDSIGKKVRVATEVASALALKNVECVHSRVEDLPLRRKWDWVVSRAVTSLDNFLPWVSDRYTSGILYLKGGDISAELEACARKSGKPLSDFSIWPLSSALEDEYYREKLVVRIKK